MDNKEVKELRKFLGLTQFKFADLLGVSIVSVRRWEAGTFKPSKLAFEKLQREVEKLKDIKGG